jgi:hypothetical protein
LVANSGFATTDATTIQANIVAMTDLLDINRNGSVDATDATIISRKIAGFDNSAATAGIPAANLGPGGASAVNSFLLGGCGNTAWQIGGNATSGTSVLGSNSAFDLDVRTAGANIYLRNGANHGIRVHQLSAGEPPLLIGGDAANEYGTNARGSIVAGGGSGETNCYEPSTGTTTRPCRNYVNKPFAAVSGGGANIATERFSTVAGGGSNTANSDFATVGGGYANAATGSGAFVAGGYLNVASGQTSTVAGGSFNTASGTGSFAAGSQAQAQHPQSFVWGGHQLLTTTSKGTGSFTADAPGGFFFGLAAVNSGCQLTNGNAGWICTSDHNTKTNITTLNTGDILRRLLAMPVSRWSYKGTENVKNIGPMAQDFWRAFGLGDSDKTIASMNMSGVALAAIQGLHQVVMEKDQKIEALEARLKRLEAVIASGVGGSNTVSKHSSVSSTTHR